MANVWKKIRAPFAKVVLAILAALKLTSPNRIVVALSPLFFTASGAILTLVVRYCPLVGRHLSRDEIVGLFITGALLGSSKLLMWLHGWQKHEARQSPQKLLVVGSSPVTVVQAATGSPADSPAAPAAPVHDVGSVV